MESCSMYFLGKELFLLCCTFMRFKVADTRCSILFFTAVQQSITEPHHNVNMSDYGHLGAFTKFHHYKILLQNIIYVSSHVHMQGFSKLSNQQNCIFNFVFTKLLSKMHAATHVLVALLSAMYQNSLPITSQICQYSN